MFIGKKDKDMIKAESLWAVNLSDKSLSNFFLNSKGVTFKKKV